MIDDQNVLQGNIRTIKQIIEKYFNTIKDNNEVIIEAHRTDSDASLAYETENTSYEGN